MIKNVTNKVKGRGNAFTVLYYKKSTCKWTCAIQIHVQKSTVCPVSQSPNTKQALGLVIPNEADYLTPPKHVFLFLSSLFFIRYPAKASCLLPHFAIF